MRVCDVCKQGPAKGVRVEIEVSCDKTFSRSADLCLSHAEAVRDAILKSTATAECAEADATWKMCATERRFPVAGEEGSGCLGFMLGVLATVVIAAILWVTTATMPEVQTPPTVEATP